MWNRKTNAFLPQINFSGVVGKETFGTSYTVWITGCLWNK